MAKALNFQKNGAWTDVLELVELPAQAVGPAQVRIKVLAAAVHPSDFGQIAGTYGKLRALPAVGGREGVGEIVEVGADVTGLSVGDIVRCPEDLGVWRTEVVCDAVGLDGRGKPVGLTVCPKDIAPEQLALSFINPPTAWRVLSDFVELEKGATVILNAAKSAVGQSLIMLSGRRELKVHAVVRGKTQADVDYLKALGAAEVWDEAEGFEKKGINAALALNQVGGESVLRLIKSLSEGGVCVTIGGAAKEPVRYPTRELIFNDIQLRGFWMDKWYRSNSQTKTRAMWDNLWEKMRTGKLTQKIEGTYTLEQYKEALNKAAEPGRLGKVVFSSLSR